MTVEVTVDLRGTLLKMEGAIQEASNAVGNCVTEEALTRFDTDGSPMHLRDVQGLSPGTRRGYLRVAGGLLRRRFNNGPIDIAKLQPNHVRQFYNDELETHKTPSYATYLGAGLRSYLRYRSLCGDAVGALAAVIPGAFDAGDLAAHAGCR